VCTSTDPHDWRTRTSAVIHCPDGSTILIDSGPDFRFQFLAAKLTRIDFALFTHSHADHTHGISDLILLSKRRHLELFMAQDVYDDVLLRLPELLSPRYDLAIHIIDGRPIEIAGVRIVPVPVMHGIMKIYGFRIGSGAYITDGSQFLPETYEALAGVRQLVINGLRRTTHPTHFSFGQAVDEIEKLQPERAWVIHMAHDLGHKALQRFFDSEKEGRARLAGTSIEPSYDGLEFEVTL
jgi:phosphoribosyl 1,2-cyclic phosphate phosphodiesterase